MKQKGRVLGPYLRTKKALTSAATPKKIFKNATNCLSVPAPHNIRDAGGFTSLKKYSDAPPTIKKVVGTRKTLKGRIVFDQRVPLGTAVADRM